MWDSIRGGKDKGKWEVVDKATMGGLSTTGAGQFANPPFVNALEWEGEDIAVGLGDGGVEVIGYR